MSGTCLRVIQQNVQKGKVSRVWNSASAPPSDLTTTPGESFYIEILALVFSFTAAIFSHLCALEYTVPTQSHSVEQEDNERECLISEPGPDRDEWGD